MTEKRYYKDECFGICDNKKGDSDYTNMIHSDEVVDLLNSLTEENEQLKQDKTIIIQLLENQSIIIQKLHSKILDFQLKEPIVLTKEDLELMGKAISYYTHGRYGE